MKNPQIAKFVGAINEARDPLNEIKQVYIRERVHGYVDPDTGETQPPMSQEQAEQQWQQFEQRLRQWLLNR